MEDINTRAGKVAVATELMETWEESALKTFFSNFYPYRIDDKGPMLKIYHGCSPLFRALNPGDDIPRYDFVFHRNESGEFIIKEVIEIIE